MLLVPLAGAAAFAPLAFDPAVQLMTRGSGSLDWPYPGRLAGRAAVATWRHLVLGTYPRHRAQCPGNPHCHAIDPSRPDRLFPIPAAGSHGERPDRSAERALGPRRGAPSKREFPRASPPGTGPASARPTRPGVTASSPWTAATARATRASGGRRSSMAAASRRRPTRAAGPGASSSTSYGWGADRREVARPRVRVGRGRARRVRLGRAAQRVVRQRRPRARARLHGRRAARGAERCRW